MLRHLRPDRPALVTTAPESSEQEFHRRHARYAVMAAIFITSFTAAALTYRHTVVALLLCGIAIVTLVAAVIGANTRSSPRRPDRTVHVIDRQRRLPPP